MEISGTDSRETSPILPQTADLAGRCPSERNGASHGFSRIHRRLAPYRSLLSSSRRQLLGKAASPCQITPVAPRPGKVCLELKIATNGTDMSECSWVFVHLLGLAFR